ncbi:MAG: MBG domain-containing protein [Bacteroidota bacterium]
MKKVLLPLLLLAIFISEAQAQNCVNPVFSVNEDFDFPDDPTNFDSEILPDCWRRVFPRGANDQTTRIGRNSESAGFGTVNSFLRVNSGNGFGQEGGIALLPEPLNYNGQLSFRGKIAASGITPFDIEVVAYLGGTNSIILGTYNLGRNWQTFTLDLSTYNANGNEVSIGFRHPPSFTGNRTFNIDDVVYTSACPPNPSVTANARDITVTLDETGSWTITPQDVNNGSADQCGNPVMLSVDRTSFDCTDIGNPATVTLTATAAGGQTDQATATVTIGPFLGPQSATAYVDANGIASLAASDVIGTGACTGLTYGFGTNLDASLDYSCVEVGANFFVENVVAEDGSGGSWNQSILVQVQDTISPTFVGLPSSYTVNLGTNSSVFVDIDDDIGVSLQDNCVGTGGRTVSASLSQETFTCADIGSNVVQAIVEDQSGNQTVQDITIIVQSGITQQTVSTATTGSQCIDGSTAFTVTVDASETGLEYLLTNEADGSILAGPTAGTGNAIDFTTGNLSQTTTFEVLAQTPPSAGNALLLEGDGDKGIANRTWDFDYTQGFTLEFAFNGPARPTNFFNTLFSLGDLGQNDFELYFQQGTSTLVVGKGRGTSGAQFSQYGSPANNTDVHIAVVFDPNASERLKVYYDGVVQTNVNNNPITNIQRTPSTARWNIGDVEQNQFSSLNAAGSGTFDEVRVWSTPRTESEILANKDGCVDNNAVGLEHYYKLDETSGTVINDAKGTLDLSITNSNASSNWTAGSITCLSSDCQVPMANTVTIGDTDVPQLATVMSLDLELDQQGNAMLDLAAIVNAASDNCSDSTALIFTSNVTQFDCSNIGANQITITVEDEAGNQNTRSLTVNIMDTMVPTIAANNIDPIGSLRPPLTLSLATNNELTIDIDDLRATVSDNCDGLPAVSLSKTAFTCADVAPAGSIGANQTITITATDSNGNQSTATESVRIVELENPIASTQSVSISLDANGNAVLDPALVNDNSSDNCTSTDDLLFSLSQTNFDCDDLGVNNVTFTVEDASGNTNTEVVSITVIDNIAPVAIAQDITVDRGAIFLPAEVDNGSSDNCAVALSLDQNVFNTLGTNTVTLTATDPTGNTATATATVSVVEPRANQTITFAALPDVTYGDGPISLTASASSNLPVSYSVTGPATLNMNEITITGVGMVSITAEQSGDANFNAAPVVSQSFDVDAARITITPDDQEVFVGTDLLPAFSLSYTGFVNGEDASVFGFQATADAPSADLNAVGTYPIVIVQDAIAANYIFTNEQGTLTVKPTPLNVTSMNVSIYPNPVTDLLQIDGSNFDRVIILSLDGKNISRQGMTHEIDVTDLSSGQYLVQLIDNGQVIHEEKIIKR